MKDFYLSISKVDDDNFIGSASFEGKEQLIFASDYIEALEQAKDWLASVLTHSTDGKEQTESKNL